MNVMRAITLATALGALVTGGSLFAFSTFVMPALNRLPADQAVRAMQAINDQAPRSLLMLPLIGSALRSVLVAPYAVIRSGTAGRGWLILGAVLALGAFVITAAYHVPHNNALATVDPGIADIAIRWSHFYTGWLWWNHARTLVALAGGAILGAVALRR